MLQAWYMRGVRLGAIKTACVALHTLRCGPNKCILVPRLTCVAGANCMAQAFTSADNTYKVDFDDGDVHDENLSKTRTCCL